MGIPHLTAHLEPYATEKSLRGQDAVIDGPALAYHIYHLSLTLRPGAKNPFEAAPTYRELGEGAILWLDLLESYDINIKKIFFDGFLPFSKREVRISRLETYTRQLSAYHAAYHSGIPCSKLSVFHQNGEFISGSFTMATKIPAATFLVPAIIKALFQSPKYRSIVQVVPHEADSFCAAYVRANGGLIFTGDSDLLVHDLGVSGSVVFLRHLNLGPKSSERDDLRCLQYQPHSIATKLKLVDSKGLGNLAFAISMDEYPATMRNFVERSKDVHYIMKHKEAYEAFCKDYNAHTVISSIDPMSNLVETSQILQTLHPRLSEFILQFPTFSNLTWSSFNLASPHHISNHNPNKAEEATKEIFLPFILDNPQRTSAWDLSTSIRLVAYSLLNLIIPSNERIEIVIERRRQENGSSGRRWTLPCFGEIVEASQSLIQTFRELRKKLPGIEGNIWRAYAVYIDLENAKAQGKTALSEIECYPFNRKGKQREQERDERVDVEVKWDTIHYIAQLHATYYSLLLLNQILNLIFSIPVPKTSSTLPPFENERLFRPLLSELRNQLTDLPPLAELPCFTEERERIGGKEMKVVVGVVRVMLGLDSGDGEKVAVVVGERERKRRKIERDGLGAGSAGKAIKKSNNPFDALLVE